jgi:hypothetical protein
LNSNIRSDFTIFLNLFEIEGPEEATRGGGAEWEPIKIPPRRNLAYILKSTRRPSLLTWPRPHSYSEAIGLRDRVRDCSGNTNSASKTTCEIDDKNRIEDHFISSQTFLRTPGGRVWKITVGEQFEPWILESFDPVTQELNRDLITIILKQHEWKSMTRNAEAADKRDEISDEIPNCKRRQCEKRSLHVDRWDQW